MGHLRLRTAGLAAAALAVTLLPAGPAAAVNDWGTLDGIGGSRLQACKVPVDGQAWRIELRVKAGQSAARGKLRVYRGEQPTDRRWRSGRVPAHSTSQVGSVRVPRGARRWQFLTEVSTSGGGSSSFGFSAVDVNRC